MQSVIFINPNENPNDLKMKQLKGEKENNSHSKEIPKNIKEADGWKKHNKA